MIDETADTAQIVSTYGGIPAKNHKGENLLIFIGIIDILQSFGMAKKLEHTWKSLIHDGDQVSVHRPSFYAKRFKTFLSERVFRKMPPNLKPALSFRRSQGHYKRGVSRDAVEDGREKKAGEAGVTVITIGGQGEEAGQPILPAVLRDKPRVSTSGPPPRSSQQTPSGRPDVADVVAVSCTPPPTEQSALNSPGMSGDERVQIYVPSPQSTPYSTISKQAADSHKSITFLSYQPDSLASSSSKEPSPQEPTQSSSPVLSGDDQEVVQEAVQELVQVRGVRLSSELL